MEGTAPQSGDESLVSECQCGEPDWRLGVQEGAIWLKCQACGLGPRHYWAEGPESVSMEGTVPVTATPESDCDGEPLHGEEPCDCDWFLVLRPRGQE